MRGAWGRLEGARLEIHEPEEKENASSKGMEAMKTASLILERLGAAVGGLAVHA